MRPAIFLLLLVAGAGCGASSDDRLDVFAASSLRDVLTHVDDGPRYTFAGSDELAAQIRDGAGADLFLSASERVAGELRATGAVREPVVFASNRLVVAVPRDNPGGVESLDDLARPGLKLVLAGDGVPAGEYARRLLAAADLDAAHDNVVSLEQDVKGVLGKVALGEADAGIVYATDVRAAGDDVRALAVAPELQPEIGYYAAVVADGDTAAAERYLERLLGEAGARALRGAGFLPPPR